MPRFIINTSDIIDWDKIIKICNDRSDGDRNTVKSVVDRSEAGEESELLNRYRKIINNWINAGYKLEEIEWWDYYPRFHFDIEIQNKISEIIKVTPRRVFISELYPGKFVPWHRDIEDKEDEWLLQGNLVRYVIFIQKPQIGHMFPLENKCFYNINQGELWQWDNYTDWHAGVNLGTVPHYLFHFLGTPL